MKMQKVSFAAISLTQWILAVTLLALAACGNSVSNPSQETGEVSISGNLSLKGAEPGAWWAVTDDQGQVWKITSPSPDQTFFGDDVISVHLELEPALKPNQTITWHLNGKQLEDQPATASQFSLQGLSRGTYAIAATLLDQETGESQSTQSVSFFVRQPSELSPLRRKP